MLAFVPPHRGGLLPLSLGLLHSQEIIRDCTVDILDELRQYPVRFPFPSVLVLPRLISVSGALDRNSIPPIVKSLPEIRIREASSSAESQSGERTEQSLSIPTAATDGSRLRAEGTFKPKRIESYWELNGIPKTGR